MGEPTPLPQQQQQPQHAHMHVMPFLALPERAGPLRVLEDGARLTAAAYGALSDRPILVRDTPARLGLRLEEPPALASVAAVAAAVGPQMPVRVIDVRHQEELPGWTLGDLAEYFEERRRAREGARTEAATPRGGATAAVEPPRAPKATPPRACRAAAAPPVSRVLNQISLELSRTALARRVTPPQFVRDLSWAHTAWPWAGRSPGPGAELYCLTGAGGAYTDFHIDFGGTSVWYHVVTGVKQFLLLEPSEANLRAYEDWLRSRDQAVAFLPERLEDPGAYVKLTLRAGETLVIPSGWIHAVYTAEDAVVFGGNFLHGLQVQRQLRVQALEERTRVPRCARFPYFEELHFYAGAWYLRSLQQGQRPSQEELSELPHLIGALREWWTSLASPPVEPVAKGVDRQGAIRHAALDAAELCGHSSVEEFMSDLEEAYEQALQKPDDDSPAKKKIRLKLAVPDTEYSPAKTEATGGGFRIKLSSSSTQSVAIPRQFMAGVPAKEDVDWIDEAAVHKNDEEWKPSPSLKVSTKRMKSATKRPATKGPAIPNHVKSPKLLNARERLLKRFR